MDCFLLLAAQHLSIYRPVFSTYLPTFDDNLSIIVDNFNYALTQLPNEQGFTYLCFSSTTGNSVYHQSPLFLFPKLHGVISGSYYFPL